MRLKKISALSLAAAMSVCTVPAFGAAETENVNVPKYIFLFIGDGMSYPQVQTTNYYLNAIADDGDDVLTSESKLNMMKFPVAGSAQTYDSTSFCPDSASTATSISTGHKTYSGTINMDEKMETSYETIAEKLKKQLGYKVGILSSVNLNHATPAAFYAHQPSRNNYYEIGQELIASDFDYFAGGGLKKTTGPDKDKTDLYQLAEEAGYKVIKTQEEAQALTAEDGKAIVIDETLADSDAMSYDMDLEEGEWGLSDYVEKGIEVLNNDTGFFMMVEGGKIDWACHSNDAATTFHEVIDFDNAIKVAYEFYSQHPDETLIVVTADHETGGFVLGKGPYELNLQVLKNQKVSESGFTKVINQLRSKTNNQVSWEAVQQALKDNFGFWDKIQLNEKQEARLKNVYEQTMKNQQVKMEKSEYAQDEPIAAEAKRIINEIALTGWTSGGHSAGYVPVFAIGVGAEKFQNRIDNTEIPVKIAEAAGYSRK